MSAADDDTELRDLLIQNLENSGVLHKIKAEMRAAVFLAMEEQDRLENKAPLINESLKKCLNSRDGRLVASLILDFLQVFNLDFSLSVFQPEINSLNGLDSRDLVCRDLGLSESELNKNSPLLLELVKRGRHPDDRGVLSQEPSPKQMADARNKFHSYDQDQSGSLLKEDLKKVFMDLFPAFNRNMLEKFINDELTDRSFSKVVDLQLFLRMYRRLFLQCRTVVCEDSAVNVPEDRLTSTAGSEESGSVDKGDLQQQASKTRTSSLSSSSGGGGLRRERPGPDLDLEGDEDPDDGDSFFDDPLPKPQKTYGWKGEASGARGNPAGSLSEGPKPGAAGTAGSSLSEQSHSRNGAASSGGKGCRASSLPLEEDVEYDDDFNSHRSDLSRSDLSIGEEIEEVSIEGPDHSDKLDESTVDLSVSQMSQDHGADYMEEVS